MTAHVDDKLAELALDLLPAEDRAAVETHLAGCARCTRELAAIHESMTAVAIGEPIVAPPARLRRRLLDDVEGRARFAPFADRVARFFGIGLAGAAAALEAITEESAWRPGPLPGLWSAAVPDRLTPSGQIALFLRSEARCPEHRHRGEERLLILQGGLVDSEGDVLHAGDSLIKPAGSQHSFEVLPGAPCIAAYLLEGGLELIA